MEILFYMPHPFFVLFRKHFCPNCGGVLKRIRMERITASGTLEAKQLCEYHGVYPFNRGDFKIAWYVFECNQCSRSYSINKMYKLYKDGKRKNR